MSTLFFLFLSCTQLQTTSYEVCELQLSALPSAARPGETVVITGGPLSAEFDLYVAVAGVRAEVQDFARTECDACDTCLLDNACQACGTCIPCTAVCDACVETTTITVPLAPSGDTRLTMVNVFGAGSAPFRVQGADTAATGDTGPIDDTAPPTDTATTADTAAATPTADTGPSAPIPTADTATRSTANTADTADTSTP